MKISEKDGYFGSDCPLRTVLIRLSILPTSYLGLDLNSRAIPSLIHLGAYRLILCIPGSIF